MKIINKTHWRTDQIRTFLSRIAKQEELSADKRKRLIVTISYTKSGDVDNGYSSGHAWVGGRHMTVSVSKENLDKVDFAHVIAHEMAHIRGLQHKQMNGRIAYSRVGNWREFYAWAETLPLEVKEVKAKQKADVQETRYESVLTRLKSWETKLKRASNAIKKLRTQQRYYEKALAAKGKLG